MIKSEVVCHLDVKYLKEFIYENNHVENVLNELGMHHTKWHNGKDYITCGQPDGDNPSSTVIYNNEHLNVMAYTRDIKDTFGNSDIISLTCFIHKCYFSNAIKILCDIVGLDYYFSPEEELPESIKWTKQLLKMQQYSDDEENEVLKPIDESILAYYVKRPILQWSQSEGITIDTQREFEIGFDLRSERITMPIRDDIANLVGVKGRLFLQEATEVLPKYMYLERCAKTHILFGLYKSFEHIKQMGYVIVCESEKGVMQLWSQGYKNAVSIGGHSFSKTQIEKITRLNCSVVLAFDKDILEEDVLKECCKFMDYIDVCYILDKDNILNEKESPMDDKAKFKRLIENNKYVYVRG